MADRYEVRGLFSDYIDIIIQRQLLDTALWEKCVNVFSSGIDNHDAGWRGEYWGKMMRGACLIYSVRPDEKLYEVLTQAVNGLLSKQTADGRISSYRADEEFFGWDMWSRKYVMSGLQHFYDICVDEELKKRIITALTAHADYITDRVGEGKINILETGSFWGGVNSASILEPFVRLYKDTKNEKYLDFARYIISTGGCRDGNLIDCALNGMAPFEFPEQKAYETMSFFEGLLAFYEVTGEKKYYEAVCNFTKKLIETDITVIGSCGCTHELFDNSFVRQTENIDGIMQETCVTVTLIRFLSRLYGISGDRKLTELIRLASLNALAGALNVNGYEQYGMEEKKLLPGMLFDSYSPLCDSKRGLGIGGFKRFADGTYFGCCACIASAGFALYPMMALTEYGNSFCLNYVTEGFYEFGDGNDPKISFDVTENAIYVAVSEDCGYFSLKVTEGDEYTLVRAFAPGKEVRHEDGYTVLEGMWNDGDVVTLEITGKLTVKRLNGKISFNYGGFALAADVSKTAYNPGQPVDFIFDEQGNPKYEIRTPQQGEQVRIDMMTKDGAVTLTDYASAGQDGKSVITVWFKI